jgi:hypothetical protein
VRDPFSRTSLPINVYRSFIEEIEPWLHKTTLKKIQKKSLWYLSP